MKILTSDITSNQHARPGMTQVRLLFAIALIFFALNGAIFAMTLTSNYNKSIFWRVFDAKDEINAIGLTEGIVTKGQVVNINTPGHPRIKLELKHDWLGGAFIEKAGRVWEATSEVVLDGTGGLTANNPAFNIKTLKSEWKDESIFWRVFGPNDSIYVAGLKEGRLHYGQTASISVAGFEQLKIEIKRENLFGEMLVGASLIWGRNTYLTMTNAGLMSQGRLIVPSPPRPLQLRLSSGWTRGTLFWRVFSPGDTVYAVGLRQGTLAPGEATLISVKGLTEVKLEIKQGGLGGAFLVHPGQLWPNGTSLHMADTGLYDGQKLVVAAPPPPADIPLLSTWDHGRIFWRVFAPNDNSYIVGLAEGTLLPGQTAKLSSGSLTQLKLEIKKEGLTGEHLIYPGRIWESGSKLTMSDDGLSNAGVLVVPVPKTPVSFRLTSKWKGGRIFWRVFAPTDGVNLVGLKEGILAFGESATISEGAYKQLKLEIRREGLTGEQLVSPSLLWAAGSVLEMAEEGLKDRGALVVPAPAQPIEVAQLTSDWTASKIFWRVFKDSDTSYIVGLAEGVLSRGQTASIVLSGTSRFKLEIKREGLLGEQLIAAGHVWHQGIKLKFNDQMELQPALPKATSRIRVTMDDPYHKNSPIHFVSCFVTQDVGSDTITLVTDSKGEFDYFGGSRMEIKRGNVIVCTAWASDLAANELRITEARVASAFKALRDRFQKRAPEIRARANFFLKALEPRIANDFANVLSKRFYKEPGKPPREIRLTDFYAPLDTKLLDSAGKPIKNSSDQDIFAYATDRNEHYSADNPSGLAEKLVFSLCASRALDGPTDGRDTLIASILEFFKSQPDPQLPVIRRRNTDREEVLKNRLDRLKIFEPSEAREKEKKLVEKLIVAPEAWQMEASVDEYTAIVNALASIGRWGPPSAQLYGGRIMVQDAARELIDRLTRQLERTSYFVTARTGKNIVMSARGPGALLNSSAFLNAAKQAKSNLDTFIDREVPLIDYAALRHITLAQSKRLGPTYEGVGLCDIYNMALTGQLPGLIATTLAFGPLAADAVVKLAGFLIPDPGVLLGPGAPVGSLVAGIVGTGIAAPVLTHPTRPSSYYEVAAHTMATDLWGFAPWWSATLTDRGAIAAFASTRFANTWALSLPRHDPKGGYNSQASQMRDCAQLLCTGALNNPDQFIERLLDPNLDNDINGDVPNYPLERCVFAWCVACIALDISPGLDFASYEREVLD